MANGDLDRVIRQLAKQQHKTLTSLVKTQRQRTTALAAKAKDAATRQYYRQLAKDIVEIGTAAARRLQMSADNAADSYARSIRQATEAATATKQASATKAAKAAAKKPAKKPPLKTSGKTAKA